MEPVLPVVVAAAAGPPTFAFRGAALAAVMAALHADTSTTDITFLVRGRRGDGTLSASPAIAASPTGPRRARPPSLARGQSSSGDATASPPAAAAADEDPPAERVRGHRAVFAAASPYLHGLLTGPMRESGQSTIAVDFCSPATFRVVKRWLYLRDGAGVTLENALDVRVAANYLMLPDLEALALRRLVPFIMQTETALALLAVVLEGGPEATTVHADLVELLAIQLCFYAEDAVSSPVFPSLPRQGLRLLLSIGDLCVPEPRLLEALLRWTAVRAAATAASRLGIVPVASGVAARSDDGLSPRGLLGGSPGGGADESTHAATAVAGLSDGKLQSGPRLGSGDSKPGLGAANGRGGGSGHGSGVASTAATSAAAAWPPGVGMAASAGAAAVIGAAAARAALEPAAATQQSLLRPLLCGIRWPLVPRDTLQSLAIAGAIDSDDAAAIARMVTSRGRSLTQDRLSSGGIGEGSAGSLRPPRGSGESLSSPPGFAPAGATGGTNGGGGGGGTGARGRGSSGAGAPSAASSHTRSSSMHPSPSMRPASAPILAGTPPPFMLSPAGGSSIHSDVVAGGGAGAFTFISSPGAGFTAIPPAAMAAAAAAVTSPASAPSSARHSSPSTGLPAAHPASAAGRSRSGSGSGAGGGGGGGGGMFSSMMARITSFLHRRGPAGTSGSGGSVVEALPLRRSLPPGTEHFAAGWADELLAEGDELDGGGGGGGERSGSRAATPSERDGGEVAAGSHSKMATGANPALAGRRSGYGPAPPSSAWSSMVRGGDASTGADKRDDDDDDDGDDVEAGAMGAAPRRRSGGRTSSGGRLGTPSGGSFGGAVGAALDEWLLDDAAGGSSGGGGGGTAARSQSRSPPATAMLLSPPPAPPPLPASAVPPPPPRATATAALPGAGSFMRANGGFAAPHDVPERERAGDEAARAPSPSPLHLVWDSRPRGRLRRLVREMGWHYNFAAAWPDDPLRGHHLREANRLIGYHSAPSKSLRAAGPPDGFRGHSLGLWDPARPDAEPSAVPGVVVTAVQWVFVVERLGRGGLIMLGFCEQAGDNVHAVTKTGILSDGRAMSAVAVNADDSAAGEAWEHPLTAAAAGKWYSPGPLAAGGDGSGSGSSSSDGADTSALCEGDVAHFIYQADDGHVNAYINGVGVAQFECRGAGWVYPLAQLFGDVPACVVLERYDAITMSDGSA